MRKLNVNEKGERIYKRIVIKVFSPDGKQCSKKDYTAPRGCGITQPDIDAALKDVFIQVEQAYPNYKYKMVILPDQQYNFVPEIVN